jgi:hypothetical protein
MKSDPKNNCYRVSECDIILTGWLTQFWVCRTCHLEVSEKIAFDFEQRQRDKKKPKKDDEFGDL